MPTYTNPVLAGMHPDPSVCRHGDDYYLVCSNFEYWPALPLFHSRDLVHWRPIGHALSRPEQVRLDVDLPSGDNGAYVSLQEIDAHSFAPLSAPTVLTRGVVQDATAAEAPRLLRHGAYIYLLIAEGGTAQHHAVTVLRAKDVQGPYEVAPHNPILTHRHLGPNAAVQAVGHADWVHTPHGDWWMLALATRPLRDDAGGVHDLLGRETFLLPMAWHNDWPLCCPGQGQLPLTAQAPALPTHVEVDDVAPAFAEPLGLRWRWLRTPRQVWWHRCVGASACATSRPASCLWLPQGACVA
jgi:beta-xylosidase